MSFSIDGKSLSKFKEKIKMNQTEEQINDFLNTFNKGTIIHLAYFGSYAYGLNNEKSDLDFKGIYIPNYKDMVLGRVKHSINLNSNKDNKNTSEDFDLELISIQKFISMCLQGTSVAIDMLHINEKYFIEHTQIVRTNNIWNHLVERRKDFYTKNMVSFLGLINKAYFAPANIHIKYYYHGMRLAFELINLYKNDDYHFPLEESNLIKSVKEGVIDINQIKESLTKAIEIITRLSKESKYPETIPIEVKDYWEDYLVKISRLSTY